METSADPKLGIDRVVATLASEDNLRSMCHMRWRGEPLPSQADVKEIIDLFRALMFPGFFGNSDVNRSNILYHTGLLVEQITHLLGQQIAAGLAFGEECDANLNIDHILDQGFDKAQQLVEKLPELRQALEADVRATYLSDPAALSTQEVIFCYPGIKAIANYRLAHALLQLDVPIIPRMISEQAHSETGVDIHPGASIGRSFTIDHGTGVVIGATAIIGDNVKIYQGVTLGARSFSLDDNGNPVKGTPRHPIIGNDVIIYSNASILGRITIGDGAIIGGNVWVTTDVAPGERVLQGRHVEKKD
ncbi:MAG: serine acetyltransferase [Muribaculaceae bacterium]|nr:serine acetyltransferase [Muribaculaceae bacterium]MDE6320893.1 serine acetyltransferase [Muribaculaceae bacterium]